MSDAIKIKKLISFDEFKRLIHIQRAVWKHPDVDITPEHQFAVSSKMGGILLGAFAGQELIGFVYSFPAVYRNKHCQHSHLLAVLPEYQGRGIGKSLKLAQRNEALRRGYDLITWTYDPLQAKNANLNLQALAAISRTYLPNFYGQTESLCLGPRIPTDRLLIEWPIKTKRVQERLTNQKKEPGYKVDKLPKALEKENNRRSLLPVPGRMRLSLDSKIVLVESPPDIKALLAEPAIIAAWQKALRRVMSEYFKRGFRADYFIFGPRSFYVLRK